MKNLLASGMLLLVMSCGLLDIDSPMGMSRLDTMRHPDQEDGPDKAAGRPGTYITAVDFEEDYDWRRDTAYGQARGNIILYKDSKPILSLEAGPGTGISTDLDRHHFIGGHLYTEYSDGRQTIIKMDGDEICRYEGNEVIKGMIADKDALYVLSQNASGEGFTLRKNWKPVLVKSGGMPLGSMNDPSYSPSGALYKDNGQICMAYYRSPGPGNGAKAWHFIRGHNESEIRLPTGMETICDIKSIGGHLCIAGRATDGKTPIICIDDACHRIEGTGPVGNDLRLYEENNEIRMYGTFTYNRVVMGYTGYCSKDGLLEYRVMDCSCFKEGAWLATRFGLARKVYLPDGVRDIGGQYRFLSCRCLAWTEKGVSIVLTPVSDKDKPVLWENGIVTPFDINGYLTSITVSN